MPRPQPGTYLDYYSNYINLVKEDNLQDAFENQQHVVDTFFRGISEARSCTAYAEGKWTIKELLQHVIDTERILAYRALSFARGESQQLPGFDENEYAVASDANHRTWDSLCEELSVVRKSTRILFDSFTDKMLSAQGHANKHIMAVLAAGFIITGHLYHHMNITRERYL